MGKSIDRWGGRMGVTVYSAAFFMSVACLSLPHTWIDCRLDSPSALSAWEGWSWLVTRACSSGFPAVASPRGCYNLPTLL